MFQWVSVTYFGGPHSVFPVLHKFSRCLSTGVRNKFSGMLTASFLGFRGAFPGDDCEILWDTRIQVPSYSSVRVTSDLEPRNSFSGGNGSQFTAISVGKGSGTFF